MAGLRAMYVDEHLTKQQTLAGVDTYYHRQQVARSGSVVHDALMVFETIKRQR